ncbi:hypothetical protein Megpolyxen_00654 [Candidatus Megaera polyxenophila]|nr:hypothetical protein Megpolyxen_00654 [Candidatus Megaera polyxenophila]
MLHIKKSVIFFTILMITLSLNNFVKAGQDIIISNLVTKYLQFQDNLGKSTSKNHIKEIKKLFVPEIVCIEDGQVFAKGYHELEKRYLELKEMYGNWGVVLQKQNISENGLTVTIQYELVTEKAGIFHVVSILHMSKDQKISVVDESYYRVDTELDDD